MPRKPRTRSSSALEESEMDVRASTKKQRVQLSCDCDFHPPVDVSLVMLKPTHLKVVCSNGTPFSAVLSKVLFSATSHSYDIQVMQAVSLDDKEYFVISSSRTPKGYSVEKEGPFQTSSGAIRAFKSRFAVLTKTCWNNRHQEQQRYTQGRYVYVDIHGPGDTDEVRSDARTKGDTILNVTWQDDKEVEKFMRLLQGSNLPANPPVSSSNVVTLWNPCEHLGVLSENTLENAKLVLGKIRQAVVSKNSKETIDRLLHHFISLLPHVASQPSATRAILSHLPVCNHTHQRLEHLVTMGVKAPFDCINLNWSSPLLQGLQCELVAVSPKSDEYGLIKKYFEESTKCCQGSNLKIKTILSICKPDQNRRFKPFRSVENRTLLWHGTATQNVTSILRQGLIGGGKKGYSSRGIYFSDGASKSTQFCQSNTMFLFLNEVALGQISTTSKMNSKGVTHMYNGGHYNSYGSYFYPKPTKSKSSKTDIIMDDGVIIPMSTATCRVNSAGGGMAHGEYIIHNDNQARLRYIMVVERK